MYTRTPNKVTILSSLSASLLVAIVIIGKTISLAIVPAEETIYRSLFVGDFIVT